MLIYFVRLGWELNFQRSLRAAWKTLCVACQCARTCLLGQGVRCHHALVLYPIWLRAARQTNFPLLLGYQKDWITLQLNKSCSTPGFSVSDFYEDTPMSLTPFLHCWVLTCQKTQKKSFWAYPAVGLCLCTTAHLDAFNSLPRKMVCQNNLE